MKKSFIVLVISLLVFVIELILFLFLKSIFTKSSLMIIAELVVHVLLIRFTLNMIIFPGTSLFLQKLVLFGHHKTLATDFKDTLKEYKNLLNLKTDSLKPLYVSDLSMMLSTLKVGTSTIKSYSEVYSENENQVNSKYISNFHSLIKNIYEDTINSKLIIHLEEFINQHKLGNKNYKIKSKDLDSFLVSISEGAAKATEFLEGFLLLGGLQSRIKNFFFNNIFGNKFLIKAEFKLRYLSEEIKIGTSGGNIIDAILIKQKKNPISNFDNFLFNTGSGPTTQSNTSLNKKLAIICSANGGSFETFFYKNDKIIEYYLALGNTNVLLWNYRGYGLSTGSPTFSNMKEDAENVVLFMKNYYRWSKILVHGISLGGIPACYLSSKSLMIDICIADRTFSNIVDIAEVYPLGGYLKNISWLFGIYRSCADNQINFCTDSDNSVYKVYMSDCQDSIIPDNFSLKSGLINQFIANHKEAEIYYTIQDIYSESKLSALEAAIRKAAIFLKKEIPVRTYTEIDDEKAKQSANKLNKYNELYTSDLDVLNDNNFNSEDEIVLAIVNKFNKLETFSGSLLDICSSRVAGKKFIFNYFKSLIHTGFSTIFNKREIVSSSSINAVLNESKEEIDSIIREIKEMYLSNHHIINPEIQAWIKLLIDFYECCSQKLGHSLEYYSKNPKVIEHDIRYNFVNLNCGHNGILTNNNYRALNKHLIKSGFIV